jgi:hypothetical protein
MKLRWKITLGFVGMAYLIAPYFAGMFGLGKRNGPVLWLEWLHEMLYIIAYESVYDIKPRRGLDDIFLRRPFFYGLPERPYPKTRRLQMLEERKKRNPEGNDFGVKWAEARISEMEAEGQYSAFDKRRKIFYGESKIIIEEPADAQVLTDNVEILVEVVSAAPFLAKVPEGTVQRDRWAVKLRVLRVLNGAPETNIGETLTVHVHSPVQTFGVAVDSIKGKAFVVQYANAFAKDYWGDIEIDFRSGGWGEGLPNP